MTGLLTLEEYQAIDNAIKFAARQTLVARKLIPKGPTVGFGKEQVKYYKFTEMSAAKVDLEWGSFTYDDVAKGATTINVPVLSKGFRINRRHLDAARSEGTALDTQQIYSATYKVSLIEDAMMLVGWSKDGTNYDINGLYKSANNSETTSLDWGTPANIVTSIKNTMALLMADNIFPPYNVVVNPTQYADTLAVVSGTATLYLDLVRRMIGGDVISTPVITAGTGMMIPTANPAFFDYVLGEDMTDKTEEMGLEDGNDVLGVVYECLVPRVFDTNAICTMTTI